MALDTYTNIQTAIIDWAVRVGDTAFAAAVPDFIDLTESRVNRKLRVREMETSATVTLTSGAGSLPSDFLELRHAVSDTNGYHALYAMPPSYGVNQFYNVANGIVDHVKIVNGTITTVPAGAGDLDIIYYAKVPALVSAGGGTNWLLDKAPEVYLYGARFEADIYMHNPERAPTWMALFEAAINDLKKDDRKAKYARSYSRVNGPTP